jgi:hypothetical protein
VGRVERKGRFLDSRSRQEAGPSKEDERLVTDMRRRGGAVRRPTYGEGPVADERAEVVEAEGDAHGEHDEAERGGVGPRRPRDEPPERLRPRDGHGGAGRDVGRVHPRRRGQRPVPPRRGPGGGVVEEALQGGRGRRRVGQWSPRPGAGREVVVVAGGSGMGRRRRGRRRRGAMVACRRRGGGRVRCWPHE